MNAAPLGNIRILRTGATGPPGDDDAQILLSEDWRRQAETLKQEGRASVLAGELDGRPVVLKILRLSRPSDVLARLFGATRLAREWSGYQALRRAGLPCTEPIILLRARTPGAGAIEALATTRLPGETLLRSIEQSRLSPEQERELADEAGALTARITRAGLFNRDHKPSNIIVNLEAPSGRRLVLIDAAGIRAGRGRDPAHMLAKLAIEMIGAGALPRRALLARCLRAFTRELDLPASGADRRAAWRHIEQIIHNHMTAKSKR